MAKYIILIFLSLFTLASGLNAQELQGKFSLSPFLGAGIPMGDLADNDPASVLNSEALFRKTGFKFGASLQYFFTSSIGVGLGYKLVSFGSKNIDIMGIGFDSNSKINAYIVDIHAKYIFAGKDTFRPYLSGGIGIYGSALLDFDAGLFDMTGINEIDIDVDPRFFIMAGGGIKYFISPSISLFAEATFDFAATEGATLNYEGLDLGAINSNYYFIDVVAGINIWLDIK